MTPVIGPETPFNIYAPIFGAIFSRAKIYKSFVDFFFGKSNSRNQYRSSKKCFFTNKW